MQNFKGIRQGSSTSFGRKAYARRARYKQVFNIERLAKQARTHKTITISYNDNDCKGIIYPHNDALVVTMLVTNLTTKRILVDKDSSTNFLFCDTFAKMRIDQKWLCLLPTSLKGFSGEMVQPVYSITLPVFAAASLHITSTMTNILVVKIQSSYNVIIGRPAMNVLKTITSTCHLKMKFQNEACIGEVCKKQALARECYVHELKSKEMKVNVAKSSKLDKRSTSSPLELI